MRIAAPLQTNLQSAALPPGSPQTAFQPNAPQMTPQILMGLLQQMMTEMLGMYGQDPNTALQSHPKFGNMASQAPGFQGIMNNFLGGTAQGSNGAAQGAASGASSQGQAAPTSGVGDQMPQGVQGLTFQKAADLVRKGGGEVNPGGKPTVLALRSETSATRKYEDVFVVLKPDGTLENFAASTRPTTSGNDKAMLKPGAYEISPRWRDGKFNNDAFVVKNKNGGMNVGVGRDSNGDGQYDSNEMNANTDSSLIRLHRGKADSTSSSGCLNCKDYDGFLKAVGGKDASFNMVVVNM